MIGYDVMAEEQRWARDLARFVVEKANRRRARAQMAVGVTKHDQVEDHYLGFCCEIAAARVLSLPWDFESRKLQGASDEGVDLRWPAPFLWILDVKANRYPIKMAWRYHGQNAKLNADIFLLTLIVHPPYVEVWSYINREPYLALMRSTPWDPTAQGVPSPCPWLFPIETLVGLRGQP